MSNHNQKQTVSTGPEAPSPAIDDWQAMGPYLIEQSKLQQIRPALPPSTSGNPNYTLIPFQASQAGLTVTAC